MPAILFNILVFLWLLLRHLIWDWPLYFVLSVIDHLRGLGTLGYVVVAAGQSYVIAVSAFQFLEGVDALQNASQLALTLIGIGVLLGSIVVGFLPVLGPVAAICGFVLEMMWGGWLLAILLFAGPYAFFLSLLVLIVLIRWLMLVVKRDCFDAITCGGTGDRSSHWRRYFVLRSCIVLCVILAALLFFGVLAGAATMVVLPSIDPNAPPVWNWIAVSPNATWSELRNWLISLAVVLALLAGLMVFASRLVENVRARARIRNL